MLDRLERFVRKQGEWADKTFGKNRSIGIVNHMKREVEELREATEKGTQGQKFEEVGDVLCLLSHYCYQNRIDMLGAGEYTLERNKGRVWNKEHEDSEGVIEHIK
ncbi:hypothetical protein LCGC14_1132400 [marine sediment metagenome]|uniref:Uncharacterized protein n=1 Tax=marine sediment metagenome TaxID=412755 RepID=A0A0F9Q6H5_9ZZZZ